MKIFTPEEIAVMLNMSVDDVKDMVEKHQLPALKFNNQFRITENVLKEYLKSSDSEFQIVLNPSYYLRNGGMLEYPDVHDKDELIECLAEYACIQNVINDDRIEEYALLLQERENMASTGIGKGIAFMHTRRIFDGIKKPFIILARMKFPIDFNSIDNLPVDIVFIIGMNDEKTHLRILSALSGLFYRDKELADIIRKAESSHIMEIIESREN